MTNSFMDKYSAKNEHIPYAKKPELEGQLFTIVDYKLVKNKKQYDGVTLMDTYEVVIDTEEHGEYKVDFARGSGDNPRPMFTLFANMDADNHAIPPKDLIFTLANDSYVSAGKTWTNYVIKTVE